MIDVLKALENTKRANRTMYEEFRTMYTMDPSGPIKPLTDEDLKKIASTAIPNTRGVRDKDNMLVGYTVDFTGYNAVKSLLSVDELLDTDRVYLYKGVDEPDDKGVVFSVVELRVDRPCYVPSNTGIMCILKETVPDNLFMKRTSEAMVLGLLAGKMFVGGSLDYLENRGLDLQNIPHEEINRNNPIHINLI